MNRLQKMGLSYLYLVPPVVAAIGFGIGPVSYVLYLPLWALNSYLMLLAARQLALGGSSKKAEWTADALFLIIPWLLFSVFAGMGRPPVTISGWLTTATEQQVRYTILMLGGVSALMGFALLKVKLQALGEQIFSVLGFTVLAIAIPLFILNMAFWGYYLTEVFRVFINLPAGKRPDWYLPVKMLFYIIADAEVALTYLATLFFAVAMRKTGFLKASSFRWYTIFAIIGTLLAIIPPSWSEPFSTAGYLASVPAIPFIMPYLMGVRLLRYRKGQA